MSKLVKKVLILLIIFVAVVSAIIYFNSRGKNEESIVMGKPTLPVLTFVTDGQAGQTVTEGNNAEQVEVNQLFGYTNEMDAKYMRDTITPINNTRKFTVRVNNMNNVIMGAQFEVRSLDCERLIEKTEVKSENISVDGEYTNINIELDNLISADTEYVFILNLKTDQHNNIYYYTRVEMLTDNYSKSAIDFAVNFSDSTFDEGKASNLIGYLEPKDSQDNTNLGNVNINSSFKQITWGALVCEKVTNPVVDIKEMLGQVTCIELRYKIKAKNDYDTEQYYNVTEYYRIKWNSTDIYLLDYKRTMDQVFDNTNQNISASRINLGISSKESDEYAYSKDGSYIAFVKGNGLWLMDIGKNKNTSLFAFDSSTEVDVRDSNDDNEIHVISVSDDGDVEFIVDGYMNRGEHEGMVGVALYSYNNDKNVVQEKIFIPFSRPFQILKQAVGKLSYVNEKNIMYIMLNDSIYSIDLSGNEYVQVISNLTDDNYSVNKNGNIIAWQEINEQTGASTIKTLNFETGADNIINSSDGERIKIVGFVGNDLAYGVAKSNKLTNDANGNQVVPMYELRIINEAGEQVKSYSSEGYYFTDTKISDNMINMSRVKYAEDGITLEKVSDYQVFGNEEKETDVVTATTITTDLKQTEHVINFSKKVTTSSKLSQGTPKEITVNDSNSLSIRELTSSENKYFVYGYGNITGIYDLLSNAIVDADKVGGVVIGNDGNYAWARISKPTEYNISNITLSATASPDDGPSQLAICINALLSYNGINIDVSSDIAGGKTANQILSEKLPNYKVFDLSGCTVNEVLYYICSGEPVLAAVNNNNYVLIVGYDFYNATILDPTTGTTYKKGLNDTAAMFAQTGNKFIGVKSKGN